MLAFEKKYLNSPLKKIKYPNLRCKAWTTSFDKKELVTEEIMRNPTDERHQWQWICCYRCCLSTWFHKSGMAVANQLGRVTLLLPGHDCSFWWLCLIPPVSQHALLDFVGMLTIAETWPRGEECVVKMNSHGPVAQTSTSSDLRAFPDFPHLVWLGGMLSHLNPSLAGCCGQQKWT